MIHQLRTYELFEHNRVAYHDRFRDHAWRIMQKYGFSALAFWETESDDRLRFLYLLEWPDEETMRTSWTEFLADEEWREIKRVTGAEHGDLVGDISDDLLIPTTYSPNRLG